MLERGVMLAHVVKSWRMMKDLAALKELLEKEVESIVW